MRATTLVIVTSLSFIAACDTDTVAPAPGPDGTVQLVALPDVATHQWSSGLDSLDAVVTRPLDWQALWWPQQAPFPVPSIDFREYMLLVVASGERSGHAWTIRIDSASSRGTILTVYAQEYRTCATTGARVDPFHVVGVERRAWTEIRFVRGAMPTNPCGVWLRR